MPVDVDVSHAPQYLVFTVTGAWPDSRAQQEMHRQLHAGGHLTTSTRALIDLRHADIPRYQQAEETANTGTRNAAWPSRCAFVIGSVVQYGFSRQLQALAPGEATVEIFTDEHKALEWLLAV